MDKQTLVIRNFEKQRERWMTASLEHAAIACSVSYTTVIYIAKELIDSKRWDVSEFKL